MWQHRKIQQLPLNEITRIDGGSWHKLLSNTDDHSLPSFICLAAEKQPNGEWTVTLGSGPDRIAILNTDIKVEHLSGDNALGALENLRHYLATELADGYMNAGAAVIDDPKSPHITTVIRQKKHESFECSPTRPIQPTPVTRQAPAV
jgi:hypothetical protein